MKLLTYLLFPLGVAWFALVWCISTWTVSVLGGWRRLARTWQANRDFHGPIFRYRSGRLGRWISYGNALTIGADGSGLFLAVPLPFKVGHPNLFIPWHAVSLARRRGIVFNYVEFQFAPEGISLRLRERLAEELLSRQAALALPPRQ